MLISSNELGSDEKEIFLAAVVKNNAEQRNSPNKKFLSIFILTP
jgi:hypothetical protein